jgi:glycolate oxidase iron-sulfur subunit
MDSPRGRIFLMKEALEGSLTAAEVTPYVDRCLGCMACTTACPSGVEYGDLLAPFRAQTERYRRRPVMESLTRQLVRETLPYPDRFRAAFKASQMAGLAKKLAPAALAPMMALLPDELPNSEPLPAVLPAQGGRRARVALLTGCVQQALAPEVNWATARVLARNGVEVVIPQGQGCCGSLSLHIGEQAQARDLARRNLRTFPSDVDAVITNAAGCGSGIHEYPLLFAGHPELEDAIGYAERTMDISVFLDQLGIITPPAAVQPVRIAFHDACHLAHAQGVTQEPRRLLRAIPGIDLLEIPEGDMCCGSAGTYNIEQPDLAAQLGQRKIRNAQTVQPDLIATGNIGCIVQMRNHVDPSADETPALPVMHTVTILDRAYLERPLNNG